METGPRSRANPDQCVVYVEFTKHWISSKCWCRSKNCNKLSLYLRSCTETI